MGDDFMDFVLGWLSGGAFSALIGAYIGDTFRKRMYMGALLGFLLGPVGWILTAALKDKRTSCPECLAAVDPRAKRCRHCGARLPVAGSEPSPAPQPATMKCPYCAAELLINSLRDGDNTCPACRKVFEIR